MPVTRGRVKPVPRISSDQWKSMIGNGEVGRNPLIVSEGFSSTRAVKEWTPESIAERFADRRVNVAVELPQHGSPYESQLEQHRQRMTVSEFVRYMPENPGSYMAQANLTGFPGMTDELGVKEFVLPPVISQNLWLGNATQSGLHFDMGEGFLVQVYGIKTAVLVPAGNFANVYPYPDVHTKSRVDPNDFDESVFPKFAEVDRFAATLTPGDALFIPRLWWHHLVSEEISISVNAWFGKGYMRDLPATILRAGPEVMRRTARDFVTLGLMKRDFEKRLFVSKPSGLWLYEMLRKSAGR